MESWRIVEFKNLNNIALEFRKNFFKKNNIILLNGEMGSGKTTFLKAALPEYSVASPSFVHALYYGNDFIHIDAYTLDENKLFNLSLEDYLENHCIIIEWGNLIFDFVKQLSKNITIIEFKFESNIHYMKISE